MAYQQFEKYYSAPISLTSQFYFCPVPLRLDTYSGCSHQCVYCFANHQNMKTMNVQDDEMKDKSQGVGIFPTKLEYVKEYFDVAFNGKENKYREQEALAVECIKHRVPIHFGGMSDGLQPLEKEVGVTYEVLKLLKSYNYPIIFSTKGKLILEDKYFNLLKDYEAFALQISMIDDRSEILSILEPNAMTAEERLRAFKMYSDAGHWCGCRIQPMIIGLNDTQIIPLLDKLKANGVKHVMVEGLKFFSGNNFANKKIGEVFKKITGKEYDLAAYYKAIGSKNSGNDLELPTWRKYKYCKVFAEEIRKRGMTYGAADNDLRHLGDSPCCCGVEGLKGFENLLKKNTGFALFRALELKKQGIKEFDKSIIDKEYMPQGKFRIILSKEKIAKKLGKPLKDVTREDTNIPINELFDKAWEDGSKNSPCMYCCFKELGCGKYGFKDDKLLEAELRDRGTQQTF